MNIVEKRRGQNKVLEERFIRRTLEEEADEILIAKNKLMSRFKTSDWKTGHKFSVEGTTLHYDHLPKHRFVDMRTRNSKAGKFKKKNHPIHNRIMYGHANNVVRTLAFGFTDQVKKELSGDLD